MRHPQWPIVDSEDVNKYTNKINYGGKFSGEWEKLDNEWKPENFL